METQDVIPQLDYLVSSQIAINIGKYLRKKFCKFMTIFRSYSNSSELQTYLRDWQRRGRENSKKIWTNVLSAFQFDQESILV